MTTERWLPIPGWEGYYEVSDQGRVRSLDRVITVVYRGRTTYESRRRGRILYARSNEHFIHPSVVLSRDGKESPRFVHTLVLTAFVGPRPHGAQGCHADDNPFNNHLSNLRWDTQSENLKDIVRNGNHWQSAKTHCPQGHPYDEQNTYTGSVGRRCRKCNAAAASRYYARKRGAAA